MMMQDIKKDLGIFFSSSDDDTPCNAYENLRVIVGSKSEKFKNMETALKLKIKHLYNRERVIIVLFKRNNQFLFIQMMKNLGLILNSSLNKAETVLFRKRAFSNILEGVTVGRKSEI